MFILRAVHQQEAKRQEPAANDSILRRQHWTGRCCWCGCEQSHASKQFQHHDFFPFSTLTPKNPAYGRQSISRPMRILAQMPQEGGPRIPQNPIFLTNGKILQNIQKYAKISDTPFNQRSLIYREAWFLGGARIPKNPIFLKTEKIFQNAKNVQRYSKISDTPFDQRSLIHREAWFFG